jgi:hypothetical protein
MSNFRILNHVFYPREVTVKIAQSGFRPLSLSLHLTTRELVNGFEYDFMLLNFTKICRHIQTSVKI